MIRFIHAIPTSWLPGPRKNLILTGITAEDLAVKCREVDWKTGQRREIISHVRYEDHAARISAELGIDLPPSGVNAPSPCTHNDMFVVASCAPGSTEIVYVVVYEATAIMEEAGIL